MENLYEKQLEHIEHLLIQMFLISYLSSFDSYNSAYLAPISPYIKKDLKDMYYIRPTKEMYERPKSIANNRENSDRRGNYED